MPLNGRKSIFLGADCRVKYWDGIAWNGTAARQVDFGPEWIPLADSVCFPEFLEKEFCSRFGEASELPIILANRDAGSDIELPVLNRTAFCVAVMFSATGLYGQSRPVPEASPAPDTGLRRFEIGAQTAYLGLNNCGLAQSGCNQFGRGVGVAFNLNRHFAIDSSFITMRGLPPASIGDPYDPSAIEPVAGGGISEFLAGVRIESRARHWGVFARVDPGVMSWKTGTVYGSIHDFVIEAGAGVEYSPVPRLHFRVENDELAIKYHQFAGGHCYPCFSPGWTGNDEVKGGVYWSIGKPMSWTPVNTHAKPIHGFFDTANIALLTADALSQAADDLLTARNLHHGGQEGNPFSRPFIRNGWPGMTGQAILSEGEKVCLMYGAHRLRLHWLERIVPLWDMYGHATAANRNAQQE